MSKNATAQSLLSNQHRKIVVTITGGPHKGESFTLDKNTFTVGRGPENQIILPNDSKMSRTHIRVNKENLILKIENQSKRNPIFYQGIFKEIVEMVANGRIVIGDSELSFDWIDTITTANPPSLPPQNISQPPTTHQIQTQKQNAQLQVFTRQQIQQPIQQTPDPYKPIPAKKGSQGNNANKNSNSNKNMLIVVVLIIAVVLFLMPEEKKKPKKGSALRTIEEYENEIKESKELAEQYKINKKINEDGSLNRQFESAQTYYVKGFRDYRNGQYSRSISSFQAALSFDPNHILAKKYLNLSLQKYDSLTQFNMNQARRYREKSNFRLCKSAAQQVLILRRDPNDSIYKEAKQILDECDILSKGRY